MENLLRRYARLVIAAQLKLVEGDSLSINTDSSTIQFARLLAKEATLSTRQTVMIVEINHGKVVQAYPIDPAEKEIFRPPVRMVVMCHLIDLDSRPYLSDIDLNQAKDEVSTLSQFGLLSEPVFLDRRIAVPWANIPYPGYHWAAQLLGKHASDEAMWQLFSALYRLENDWASSFWEEQGVLLEYRKQRLNALGESRFILEGDGWSLKAKQAKQTLWAGGRSKLSNNRSFVPILPMQSIHTSLDCTSAEGSFNASRTFQVLGREVVGAQFTIKDGKVVAYQAEQGQEALAAFFAVDEGARTVSELSLADNDTMESRYLTKSIHPHFGKELTTSVVFGGFSMDVLATQQTDEDVDASNLCRSLVRLEIPVGDSHLSLKAKTSGGDEQIVMYEGIYTETGGV